MEILVAYDWPGNVRELNNVLERAVSLADQDKIKPIHLPPGVRGNAFTSNRAEANMSSPDAVSANNLKSSLADAEFELIHQTLARHNGNRTRTAKELGISVTTLWRRLQRSEKISSV